jgi:hypothetical protein
LKNPCPIEKVLNAEVVMKVGNNISLEGYPKRKGIMISSKTISFQEVGSIVKNDIPMEEPWSSVLLTNSQYLFSVF